MHPNQVKWACRRGMLELDLVLNDFFDNRYHALSLENQQNFVDLLSATDPELMDCLLKGEEAFNPELKEIIILIRTYANRTL